MPDFIGIGAPRCGTTWIHKCLQDHPQIYSPIKEINFFNSKKYREKISWYKSIFENSPYDLKRGEFTPLYLAHLRVAQRIKESYPNVKLIVSLRDPVERTISHYLMKRILNKTREKTPFLEATKKDYFLIENSLYGKSLQRYFNLFNREQILVLFYENLKTNPAAFIKTVYKFIGVDNNFTPPLVNKTVNNGKIGWLGLQRYLVYLNSKFKPNPLYGIFLSEIKKGGIIDLIMSLIAKKTSGEFYQSFDLDKRKFFDEFFREDSLLLKKLIGQQLPWEF